MITDIYGQQIYTEKDICKLYLTNTDTKLKNILCESKIEFDDRLNLSGVPTIIEYAVENISIKEFDEKCQSNLYIPAEYKNYDIAKYVLDLCQNDSELQRAGQELLLYQERDMFDLLRYLKYLVDTMRKHGIVWGVGRGSSVASFVLFLLGVHKINSLYYDLDINEFLK